ncbi:MAG: hypothetical protein OJF48_002008 [Afipia sp.]|nr:MAG: hypothetical protein OJF48_002008 [Afipia sp.]
MEPVDLTADISLTENGRGPISAPMILSATIIAARRRRILAVWAVDCV